MAKLYFRHGTMASGKSVDALKAAYSYEEQGRRVMVFVPSIDTRHGVGRLRSRIGVEREATAIGRDMPVFPIVEANPGTACVIVDEAQFLSEGNVRDFVRVVDELDIPVICYGLKNDFRNELFEGSQALLRFADKIEEIKSICRFCGGKATMNLRIRDGAAVYDGEQIMIGGNESYHAVCRRHYFRPKQGQA